MEWIFVRELRVDGLHTGICLGDAIVWPGPEGPGDTQRIVIRLRPPGNTALLSLARDDTLEFLAATRPLPQKPSTNARTAALASWELEQRDLTCPAPASRTRCPRCRAEAAPSKQPAPAVPAHRQQTALAPRHDRGR
ncbi:SsgA family sporulation/cell division regulator [Streptomyces sp. NBC_01116]|uniref:SsgA family sporulation/cell division regulator n=1 Tax=Streptomyces sp. NBC_01116 TaxID=2903752 RepID=UPI00352CCAD9